MGLATALISYIPSFLALPTLVLYTEHGRLDVYRTSTFKMFSHRSLLKQKAKPPQKSVQVGRSPGRFFKGSKQDSPHVTSLSKAKYGSTALAQPQRVHKTNQQEFSFEFSDDTTEVDTENELFSSDGELIVTCDGKLAGNIYSSSSREARSQVYKAPEVVHDNPSQQLSQGSILKSRSVSTVVFFSLVVWYPAVLTIQLNIMSRSEDKT